MITRTNCNNYSINLQLFLHGPGVRKHLHHFNAAHFMLSPTFTSPQGNPLTAALHDLSPSNH